MSQLAGPRGELDHMRYFTPELFLKLNSADTQTVDAATEEWEKALTSYRQSLAKVLTAMPPQSRCITDLALHDWDLLKVATNPDATGLAREGPSAIMMLKQGRSIVILCYWLTGKLRVIGAPKKWPLSKSRVHWLYDEVDGYGSQQNSFIHRILLSDGSTLLIPFSSCRVVQAKSDHAMSHSELMQIA